MQPSGHTGCDENFRSRFLIGGGIHLFNALSYSASVTRLGNLLDIRQVFKAFGNN